MSAAESSRSEVFSLRIEGEMSIYRAAELKQLLLSSLRKSPLLEVDLSEVTEIDTAGVQLLLMTRQSAQSAQRELRLIRHSPAVLEVFEMLNLGLYFNDPVVMLSSSAAASDYVSSRSLERRSHES